MSRTLIQEFAFSLPADAKLLLADVCAGAPVDPTEVLSLAATAQSLFVTATIESRELDGIAQCHGLWADVAKLFDELCRAWTDVMTDEEQIRWLRSRLEHFSSLARDRMELYEISSAERIAHAEIRGDAGVEYNFEHRHSIEPNGYTDQSSPQHVYSIGKL